MPFLIAAAAGLAAGLIGGGRLSNLGTIRWRWVPLLLPVALWRLVDIVDPAGGGWLGRLGAPVFLLQFVAVVAFAAVNWRVRGMVLIAAGAVLNALVVGINGGFMPIPSGLVRIIGGPAAAADLIARGQVGHYLLLTDRTRLPWLADVMLMPGPWPRALSLGDVVMMVGLVVAIAWGLLRPAGSVPPAGGETEESRGKGAKPNRI